MFALGEPEIENGIDLLVFALQDVTVGRACCNVTRDEWTGFWHVMIDPCRQLATPVYISLVGRIDGKRREVTFALDRLVAGSGTFLQGNCSIGEILITIQAIMDGCLVECHWRTFSISTLKVGADEIKWLEVRWPVIGSLARLGHFLHPTEPMRVQKYEPWPEKLEPDVERPPWAIKEGMVTVADF